MDALCDSGDFSSILNGDTWSSVRTYIGKVWYRLDEVSLHCSPSETLYLDHFVTFNVFKFNKLIAFFKTSNLMLL
jgi:hypothetical protein